MKVRKLKQVMAAALSATMVLGMSATVFAADPVIDAPIYSFDVVDVIVPTTYAVAFNPEGLTVKTGDSTTSTDQILSRSFGIVNKSNKDKVITVSLKVEDLNTGDDVVTFVDTAAEVTNAADGEYKIHLTVVPADATEVKVGATPAAADKDTAATDLDNVTMTKATAGKEVTLMAGDNEIEFLLKKATYSPKSGSEVTLGSTTANNVASNYDITALAGSGKGITAFTFGGEMNANADWTKLTAGIKITPVYTNATAPSTAATVTGTGAVYDSPMPKFTIGGVGVINVALGRGDDAFDEFVSISAPWDNSPLDLTSYAVVADDKSTITVDAGILGGWAANNENPTATITYTNANGDEVTATVILKTH